LVAGDAEEGLTAVGADSAEAEDLEDLGVEVPAVAGGAVVGSIRGKQNGSREND